jgi:hypothetical protein
VAAFVRSYVVLDEHQADAVALWIAHTRSTRGTLALPGDLERRDAFGESTLLELLELVVARPWKVITPTEAVVFRKLDRDQPTLLLDEYDAIWKDRDQEPLGAAPERWQQAGNTVPRSPGANRDELTDFGIFVQLTTY